MHFMVQKFKSLQSNHACICVLVVHLCDHSTNEVEMKCTQAKFGNTELRGRHNRALSVVRTHMVHQYSQVESTKCYSPHYTRLLKISIKILRDLGISEKL